jgi:Nucleotidyl transferase AbiEii toxin, Type IV TA system
MDGVWRNALKSCAVPLTSLQSQVLRLLAAQRSPDSYIAGGIAINRDGPRFSHDIDIFQDSVERLQTAVDADAASLRAAGFAVTWSNIRTGKHDAQVSRAGETILLEWVADSDFRFFPAQADEQFGYVLHPVDLATNKASAAADRREPRDVVDLLTIHETILPLGAVVAAAVGRFPGMTPEEMLAEITRHSRFSAEEFRVLATEQPIDARDIHRRTRAMLEDAERFIAVLPSDAVGVAFLENGVAVQPDLSRLGNYERHAGSRRGHWPSSSEIGRAMLERYAPPGS